MIHPADTVVHPLNNRPLLYESRLPLKTDTFPLKISVETLRCGHFVTRNHKISVKQIAQLFAAYRKCVLVGKLYNLQRVEINKSFIIDRCLGV